MPDLPIALRRYFEVSRQPAGSAFHTSQVSISFGEVIDPDALRKAWEIVSDSHDVLRTGFAADGSTVVFDSPGIDWQSLDWQAAPPEDLGAAWQQLQQGDASRPIAVEGSPGCRIVFIRLPNGGGHALWSFHGALLDPESASIVLHRWLHTYDCIRQGSEVPAFEAATKDPVPSEDWKDSFDGFMPPRPLLVLPLPEAGKAAGSRRSLSRTFERPERSVFAASAAARKSDLRSLFGAAWAFVIARTTSSDDALILENIRRTNGAGRVENLVVHRCRVESAETVDDLVGGFSAGLASSPADLQSLAQALNLSPRDLEPATAFLYREHTLNDRLQLEMPRWMAADTQLFQLTAPPIALRVTASDRPEVALDYDPAILSDTAAKLLFDLYLGTLAAFAAETPLLLHDFALPGTPVLVDGGEAPATFRSLVPQCLHELFADVAADAPDAIAIEHGDTKLTFSQLNSEAGQFARHLRKNSIQPGFRVGIAMPRSPRWITALLGAWKAGACVVPLPEGASTATAGIKAWIVESLPEGETRDLPVIQAGAPAIAGEKSRGMQNESAPTSDAIAWIDGAASRSVSHETLAAALQSTASLLSLSPSDRVLQFAPTGSFAAVEEVLCAILSGSTIVLPADSRWATRTAFQEFIEARTITALSVPTPFWSQWTNYLTGLSLNAPVSLRLAVIHGSQPSPNAIAAWQAAAGPGRLLLRTSAPEACGLGLAAEPLDSSLLGTPGPGVQARLVDKRGLPLPSGLPGWVDVSPIGGEFVPLAVEAFAAPDNTFFSRSLFQAQVVGPSPDTIAESIRLAAATHPEIIDAHVERRLIAARHEWCVWITPRDADKGEPHDFREWLTARLPSAPRRIRAIPRLPLDDSGQVDTAALAELLPEDGSAAVAKKGSDEEERLRKAISRVLGGRRIELDENITDGRTKSHVAKLLHEAVSREEPRVQLADITAGFSVRSLLRNVRGRKTMSDSSWTPLEPLRASGRQAPLVFVHDLDGSSKLYAPLVAHLDRDQPCYAITARGIADPASCHTSVVEMATAYVDALRVFDANGPYRLAGYGFGGLVAFEMARQLLDGNVEVDLLVLLASEPPRGGVGGFLSGGWKNLLFGKKASDPGTNRRSAPESPVSLANQEAARRYNPAPAQIIAHVFAPTVGFPPYRTVQSGWETCCEEARLYQVPCSGPDMMAEPAVESLAQAISEITRSGEIAGQDETAE